MSVNLFGLTENPFAAGHERRFVCPSRKRDETVSQLRRHLGEGAPLVMVTGDPGIGKTSVVWEALGEPSLMARVGVVAPSAHGGGSLLEAVCLQLGVPASRAPAHDETMARLEQHLCQLRSRGRSAILVLDDAHTMTPEQLTEVLSLSEMKAEGRQLLRVVLVGLPEVERLLARPDLKPLRERVGFHCRILPFTPDETGRYLHHRVTVAGGNGPSLFPSDTCREIHNYTYGFPRDINTLASRSLERALREKTRHVLPDHVRATVAAARLHGETSAPRPAADVPTGPPGAEREAGEPRATAVPPAPDPRAVAAPPVAAPRGPMAPTASPAGADARPRPAPAAPAGAHTAAVARAEAPPAGPPPGRAEPLQWGRGIEPPAPGSERRRSRLGSSEPIFASPVRPRFETLLQVGLAAVVVVGLLLTVLLVMRSWDPTPPPGGPPSPITAAPGPGGTVPANPALDPSTPVPTRQPQRGATRTARTPTSRTPTTATTAPVAAPPAGAGVADAGIAGVVPEQPAAGFGLEVASFIDSERAAVESERIAGSTGHPCQVIIDPTSDTYLVVLGAFASQRAAERVADDLLGRDLVRQARVVALPASGGLR